MIEKQPPKRWGARAAAAAGAAAGIAHIQPEPEPKKPSSLTHFAPGWIFTVVLVAVSVGLFTFFATNKVNSSVTLDELQSQLANNESAIKANCAARNQQIKLVNVKFEQLIVVFDTSNRQRSPEDPAPSADVLRLFEEFRKPIELFDCK